MVDDEFAVVRSGVIFHVFEREDTNRAAYNYMINWIRKNKNPSDNVDEMWTEAETAWNSLSPEVKGLLLTILEKERQQNKDIHDGLLATLHSYQGVDHVKQSFEDAIRSCLW
jgi:hypothetical protein